jgi:hypothetical protein
VGGRSYSALKNILKKLEQQCLKSGKQKLETEVLQFYLHINKIVLKKRPTCSKLAFLLNVSINK